jgi:hypothetical protein
MIEKQLELNEGIAWQSDISSLPPGMYIIRLSTGNKVQTGKIVIMH